MAKRPPSSRGKAKTEPRVPVFLLHGEDEPAMGLARTRLIEQLVPEELRAENVTEFASSSNQPLRLKQCLGDILDELATASFFPDQRRVVVVHDLNELTAKPAKESQPHVDRLCKMIGRDLAEIGNAAIFVVREDSGRWKNVQKTGALYRAIAEWGSVEHFPTDNLNFAFQDALLARDLGECLRILDRRLEQSRASDRLGVMRSVFNDLVRLTRFLIQMKILAKDRRERGGDSDVFPDDKRLNVLLQHQFVQGKMRTAASRFRLPRLLEIREALQRANRHFAPSLDDTYVADQRLMLEHCIGRICAEEQ